MQLMGVSQTEASWWTSCCDGHHHAASGYRSLSPSILRRVYTTQMRRWNRLLQQTARVTACNSCNR